MSLGSTTVPASPHQSLPPRPGHFERKSNPERSSPSETEYVAFDRPRVLRVLARIIGDLDGLAGYPPIGAESRAEGKNAEARRAYHRRRLAEPDPLPKRLTVQEERAALWEALRRPTHKRGR